jgi:hypothetical protein
MIFFLCRLIFLIRRLIALIRRLIALSRRLIALSRRLIDRKPVYKPGYKEVQLAHPCFNHTRRSKKWSAELKFGPPAHKMDRRPKL